jgi:hypothetical protein
MRQLKDLRSIEAQFFVTMPSTESGIIGYQDVLRVNFTAGGFILWSIITVANQRISSSELLDRLINDGLAPADRETAQAYVDQTLSGLVESELVEPERLVELGLTMGPVTSKAIGAVLAARMQEVQKREAERQRRVSDETTNASEAKRLSGLMEKLAASEKPASEKAADHSKPSKVDKKPTDLVHPGMPTAAGGR